MQGEFRQSVVPHLFPGVQGEVDHCRAGQQHEVVHRVVQQPGVVLCGQRAGQQQPVVVGQLNRGGEQCVVGRPQPGGTEVADRASCLQPVVVTVERVGG